MSTVIVACHTIKRELHLAIKETGVDFPVIFIDSNLHNNPDLLHQAIQQQIDKIEHVENILMAFGFCGNSLLGISSPEARIVIPRADDCITLMLGSYELSKNFRNEVGTYFLTKGWLDGEQNLLAEYECCVKRYGNEKALNVMGEMLKNYRRLVVIDTKAYKLEDILHKTKNFAEKMGLVHQEYAGSMRLLNKLLMGPWDAEFIVLEPGRKLTFDDMLADLDQVTARCNSL
jgi:hypothetical protein